MDRGSKLVLRTGYGQGLMYVLCDDVTAAHPDETKPGRVMDLGPLGKTRVHSRTGRVVKSRLRLTARPALATVGCDATGKGLRTVLRAVRPQELAVLDAERREKARLLALLNESDARMAQAAHQAFLKGHYVPLSDLQITNAGERAARSRK